MSNTFLKKQILAITESHGFATKYKTFTITGNIDKNDPDVVVIDASSGNLILTLPPILDSENRRYLFIRIDSSSNTVTIKGNGAELINDTNTMLVTSKYVGTVVYGISTKWLNPLLPSTNFADNIVVSNNTVQSANKVKEITADYTVDSSLDGNSIIEVNAPQVTAGVVAVAVTLPSPTLWKKLIDGTLTDGTGTAPYNVNRSRTLTFLNKNTGIARLTGTGADIDTSGNTSIDLIKGELVTIYLNQQNRWEYLTDRRNNTISDHATVLGAGVPISKVFSFSSGGFDFYQHGSANGEAIFTAPAIPRNARPNNEWVLDITYSASFDNLQVPLNGTNTIELGAVTDNTGTGNFGGYIPAIFGANPNMFGNRQVYDSVTASNKSLIIPSGNTRINQKNGTNVYGLSSVGVVTPIKAKFFSQFSNNSGLNSSQLYINTAGAAVVDGAYTIPRNAYAGSVANFSYHWTLKEVKKASF